MFMTATVDRVSESTVYGKKLPQKKKSNWYKVPQNYYYYHFEIYCQQRLFVSSACRKIILKSSAFRSNTAKPV